MTSIDNRIVQMDFHNGSFLKGVSQTMKAISFLKKALNFGDVKNSMNDFDERPMSSGIEKITDKLRSLGDIGVKAFDLISSKAESVGKAVADTVEDLAFGQITSSFGRYEKDVKSVQTIMFATGESIENVEKELSRLTWFTDETSYSYSDMVDNIGKFTSMKIPLADARTMMQGIAVWAASAGQGATQASHAMYNLSQAMGAGYVQKLDWRSIQTANMETAEFKQIVIDVAKELGALDAQGRTLDKSKTLVTYENFAETLNKKWFNKKVLSEVLTRYGDFADKVYELQQEYDARGIRLETSEAMKMLADSTYDFSEKAFKAAQEATTFSEAIGAVQDAASTSWLRIYKLMFGNYEQAKEIWTKLSNDLYTIFVEPLEGIENLLSNWHEVEDGFGSWNDFIQGVSDAMDGLIGIIGFVKEQLAEIIPPITIDHVKNLSLAVRDFGASLKATFGEEEEATDATEEFGDEAAESAEKATKAFGILQEEFNKLDSSLQKGAQGKEVKAMQRLLMEAGYSLDNFGADGIFGPETQAALNDFKKEAGLAVDGIYDEATRYSLIEALELKETNGYMERLNANLEKGSKGEDVKKLQRRLIEMGFDLDKYGADGVFGPETQKALKEFEKQYGLTIDGIYDEEDHKKIEELMYSSIEKTDAAANKVNKTLDKTEKSAAKLVLQHLSRGFFSFLDILRQIGQTAFNVAKIIANAFKPVVYVVLSVAMAAANALERFDKFLKSSGVLKRFENDVRNTMKPVTEWLEKAGDWFLKFVGIKDPIDEAGNHVLTFADIWNYFVRIFNMSGIVDSVKSAFERIKSSFSVFDGIIEDVKGRIDNKFGENWFEGVLVNIGTELFDFLETAGYVIEVLGDVIASIIEKIPDAIQTLKDFWATLTFEGDEETGQAPGIIARIKNFINDIFSFLFGSTEEAEEYAKADSGPISIITSAIAEESEDGNKRVNKSLRLAKGIVSTISKIIDSIKLLFTGKLSDDSKLSEDVINRINGIRNWFKSVSGFITALFSGQIAEGLDEKKAKAITDFRNGVISVVDSITGFVRSIYEKIALFVSGKVAEGTKLGKDAQEKIISIRNWIINVGKVIKTVFTGEAPEGLDKKSADRAIAFRNSVISAIGAVSSAFRSIYEKAYYFFTGNALENSVLSEDSKKKIDDVKTWLSNFGKKIKFFFTGKVPEGLDQDTINRIDGYRKAIGSAFGFIGDTLKSVFEGFSYFITGKIKDGSKLTENTTKVIDDVKSWFVKLGQKIIYLFTGKETEGLDKEAKDRIDGYRSAVSSVFAWIKDLFGGLFQSVSYFVSGHIPDGSKLSKPVISIIDSIKGFLTKVWNGIKVLFTGSIAERGLLDSGTAQNLLDFRSKVVGVFNAIKEAVSPFITNFGSTLAVLFSGKLSDRGALSRDSADKIIEFRNSVVHIFDTIKDTFGGIFSAITGFFKDSPLKLGSAVEDAGDTLQDGFIDVWDKSNFNQKVLLAGGTIGLIGGLVAFLAGKIKKLKESLGIAEKKKDDGESKIKEIASSILKIGVAVGILTASIVVLGSVDEGVFKQGMKGLLTMSGIIVGMFVLINEIGKNANSKKNPVLGIGKSVMDLAIGVGVLAAGILLLSKMKTETFLSGFWKLGLILAAVAGFLGLLKLVKFEKLNVKGFWDLAAGIEILAITIRTLSGLKIEELGMGILGLTGIMALVAGLIFVMGKVKANNINIKGFDTIGKVIWVMSSVLKSLSKMKFGKMMQGILGLGLMMAALAGFVYVLGKYGKKLKTSQALVFIGGLAGLLLAFAHAMDLTNDIDPLKMLAFSVSLALALAAFTGALMFIGDSKHGGAKTMMKGALGIAGAIGILVGALTIIAVALGGINELTDGGFIDILEQGGAVLTTIKNAYSPFVEDLTSCLTVVGTLLASEIVGLIPGGAGAMIKGAFAISVAIGELLLSLSIVSFGVSLLDTISGNKFLEDMTKKGGIIDIVKEGLSALRDHMELLPVIAGYLVASEIVGLIPGGKVAMMAGAGAISGALGILVAAAIGIVAGLGKLDKVTDGGLTEAITGGGEVLRSLGAAIASFSSGYKQVFINDMKTYSEAIHDVRENLDGISEDKDLDADIAKAEEVAGKVKGFFDSINGYAPDPTGIEGYNTSAQSLSTDIGDFGKNVGEFWTKISGIGSDGDIEADTATAINVAKTIKEDFFDVIDQNTPDGGKLKKYNKKISSVLGHVGTFAEKMGLYVTNLTGLNQYSIVSKTDAAIASATKVTKFLTYLSDNSGDIEAKREGIKKWFMGENTQDTVFDALVDLSSSIAQASQSFTDVNSAATGKDIEAAIGMAQKLAEFLVYLGGDGIVDSIRNASYAYEEMYGYLVSDQGYHSIATMINDFIGQVSDIEGMNAAAASINAVVGLMQLLASGEAVQVNSDNVVVDGLINVIVNTKIEAEKYVEDFVTLGYNFVAGLAQGASENSAIAAYAAQEVAEKMLEAVQTTIDSNSPSKEAGKLGRYFTLGLAEGAEEETKAAESASEKVAASMLNSGAGILSTLSSLIADGIDDAPVIRPVLDLSAVNASAATIGSILGYQSVPIYTSQLADRASGEFESSSRVTIQENYSNDTSLVASSISTLSDRMNSLEYAISNMKVVTETGALIGQIDVAIDNRLGELATLSERGL